MSKPSIDKLKLLTRRILKETPHTRTRDLYGALVRHPEIVGYRNKAYPGWNTEAGAQQFASSQSGTQTTEKTTFEEKGHGATAEDSQQPLLYPTRTFWTTHVFDNMLKNGRIRKQVINYKTKSTETSPVAKPSTKKGTTLVEPNPSRRVIFTAAPPRQPSLSMIPKKPELYKLHRPEDELELRRKAGEFSHLKRRRQRAVMKKALVEIAERQKEERRIYKEQYVYPRKELVRWWRAGRFAHLDEEPRKQREAFVEAFHKIRADQELQRRALLELHESKTIEETGAIPSNSDVAAHIPLPITTESLPPSQQPTA